MKRALCLLLFCTPLSTASHAAVDPSLIDGRSLVFEALKGRTVIGQHKIRFTQKGDALQVDVFITLKSKIFIVPFTYVHNNHEIWQSEKLVSVDSRTTTNGHVNTLSAKVQANTTSINADGVSSTVAGPIMTTSYWLRDMVKQARLLNTQTGAVINTKLVADNPSIAPSFLPLPIQAREYQVTGSKRFNANVLYDAAGCMVGMNFKVPFDGSRITYRLVARPDATLAPDLLSNPLISNCLTNRHTALQSVSRP